MSKSGLRGLNLPYKQRALIVLPVWAFCVLNLVFWWLSRGRADYSVLYILLSLAMMYEFVFLPTVFLYFIFRAKQPPRRIAKKGHKVAVISLCVPKKESLYIIEKQLEAMSGITYPHDSWILDEGGSKKVKKLANKYKVKYFTRKGIKKYNQPIPPFKKKTKAGNVNAWLEHVKRRKYDFFVQMDIDHLPKPDYLNQTLGYFRKPDVAWVQAPSLYKNRSAWIARGAAEQELVLQGPLQMGFYGHSETPFIIGSHCTYRTKAIEEIGGFQPTRAEDHLDTLALASKGYKGVFLPKIIAEGDGPETLRTYLAQQFAWAYSMFQVLLKHSPGLLKGMHLKQKAQFLFAQTWYPIWSLSYLTMFFIPIAALVINKNVAHVDTRGFITHFIPIFIGSFLVWWSGRPLMKPSKLHLSWRGILLHAIRWPVVLQAIIYAGLNIKKPYMITPKGRYAKQRPSTKVYLPFLILGGLSSLAIIFSSTIYDKINSEAQIIFTLVNTMFMLAICVIDIRLNIKSLSRDWLKPVLATACLAMLIVFSAISSPFIANKVSALFKENIVKVKHDKIAINKMNREQLINELRQPDKVNHTDSELELGIYNDPTNDNPGFINSPHINHIFVDWRDSRYLAEQLVLNKQTNNTVLVTLEPRGNDNGQDLLNGISQGKYNDQLDSIFEVISAYQRPVYLRFAHEAELQKLYPWSNQKPDLYIKAYRHAVDYSKAQDVSNIKWVWAPAGNPGAEEYYPGDKYVDIIGTTILYDKYWYGYSHPSFHQLAQQRLWLLSFKKPVWIVEFGAGHSDAAFQHFLIKDAMSNYKNLGFGALIYLNMIDANINGPDYILNNPAELNIETVLKHALKKNVISNASKINTNCKNIGSNLFDIPVSVENKSIFCSK